MERNEIESSGSDENGSKSKDEITIEIPKNLECKDGVMIKIPGILVTGNDAVIIKIPKNLVTRNGSDAGTTKTRIPQELEKKQLEPAFWPELCIYQAPKRLRRVNPKAYTPQSIAIGPFHHKGESLQRMEKQKLVYLAAFCERVRRKWTELSERIGAHELKIRHCYEEKFDLDKDTFVQMILLDAVFIIEFFLRRRENMFLSHHGMPEEYKDDYILGKPTRESSLLEDLILLENQLPYFVLEDLYQFATGKSNFLELVRSNLDRYLSIPEVEDQKSSCDCFSCFYCFWVSNCFSGKKKSKNEVVVIKDNNDKPLHFTDLVRTSRAYPHPATLKSEKNQHFVKRLPNASGLKAAGVRFKVDKEAWPLNIKFEKGVLTMPRIRVESNTERLIRNLMAFEQCHHPNDPYICDYMWILEFLISNENDVDVLVQNGIVVNLLGSNQAVAEMVNQLCLEVSATGSCFYHVSNELNEHCKNGWRQAVAIMRGVYFSNLWIGTGTTFAVLLLFLTLVQSVYAIMSMF